MDMKTVEREKAYGKADSWKQRKGTTGAPIEPYLGLKTNFRNWSSEVLRSMFKKHM